MKHGPKLEVISHVNRFTLKTADFESVFAKAISALGKIKTKKKLMKAGQIQLILVDDKEIRLLNAEYRGINKPTDVISLSYLKEKSFPGKENLLGEIIISLEIARAQAKENGHPLKKELIFLFIHGVLHVFGYDHETPREYAKMFALQDKITG